MPIGCDEEMMIKKKSFPVIRLFPVFVSMFEQVAHLLNKLNASSQVHAKVNELPFNSLLLILFLLQDEHVMVEELLQFFIGEVDTQLFQAVVLKKARYQESARASNGGKTVLLHRRTLPPDFGIRTLELLKGSCTEYCISH